MKTSRRLSVGVTVAACVFRLSSSAFGQECTSFCVNGDCFFDGLFNYPLGNATLSVNGSCQLIVENIGGSGVDGVVQTQLGSVYMKTTLATPNFGGSMVGTSALIRQVGIVGGQPNREIMLTRLVNYNGSHLRYAVHCSLIHTERYTVAVYNQGQLVEFLGLADPPTITFPKEDILSMACGIWPNGDNFTEVRLASPQPAMLLGPPSGPDLGPVTGDVIFIAALSPQEIPTLQGDIENIFFQTGPVTVNAMVAGELPAEGLHVIQRELIDLTN